MELTLLPFIPGEDSSNTVLPLGDVGGLLAAIMALPAAPIPDDFHSHMGYDRKFDRVMTYGPTLDDGYGRPLLCVEAGALGEVLRSRYDCSSEITPAVAFISAMMPTERVALYWA